MILDTLAEAFQGEYDVDGSHTAFVSQTKEALIEQEEDIDLEAALAALELESDTDLEETDVQEIPLAYKESRQLRGEQRVSGDQEYGVCSDDVSSQPNVDLRAERMARVERMAFMQRDVRRRSVQSFGVREGTLDKSMPYHKETSVQRW